MENFTCECGIITRNIGNKNFCKCGRVYNSNFELIFTPKPEQITKNLNSTSSSSSIAIKRVSIFLGIIFLISILFSTLFNNSNTTKPQSYQDATKQGIDKLYNGKPMTKAEENAVNDYIKWKNEQKAKEYNKNTYGK